MALVTSPAGPGLACGCAQLFSVLPGMSGCSVHTGVWGAAPPTPLKCLTPEDGFLGANRGESPVLAEWHFPLSSRGSGGTCPSGSGSETAGAPHTSHSDNRQNHTSAAYDLP